MFAVVMRLLVIFALLCYSPMAFIGVVIFLGAVWCIYDICQAVECKRKYGTTYGHGKWLLRVGLLCVMMVCFYGFMRFMANGDNIISSLFGITDQEEARLYFNYCIVFLSVIAYPLLWIYSAMKGKKKC